MHKYMTLEWWMLYNLLGYVTACILYIIFKIGYDPIYWFAILALPLAIPPFKRWLQDNADK